MIRLCVLSTCVVALSVAAPEFPIYNITIVNEATDGDADAELCLCGRGTGECESLGYVKRNGARALFGPLQWHEKTYPDGHVCYDWIRLRAGSAKPPSPYFPDHACALDNAAMGRVWEAALANSTPTLTLRGNASAYACDLEAPDAT